VTPEKPGSISWTTRVVGSRYAYYFNRLYGRTGTLWEGRHKSSLVQDERYFLTCSRYIESNPVAAGLVEKPEEYRWSSYLVNAWGEKSHLVQHDEYLRLGADSASRCHAYRELFKHRLAEVDIHLIERANQYCQPLGDDRFRRQIERRYRLRLGQSCSGRPRKQSGTADESG
jgi:putative transposase